MTVNYAKSYVDRVCDSRDISALYDIVRTLDAERNLADPYKLAVRIWEWCNSTRSGIWQYYETIPLAQSQETASMMDRLRLGEIAVRYRAGMENWEEPRYCGDLDSWIELNWDAIENAVMALVESDRECLYPIRK